MHPTDEILLALAHGELDDRAANEARAHCAGCAACTTRAAMLEEEQAEIGRLLRMLDHPVPALPIPVRMRSSRRRRSTALAASLALLFAGAAAAAVPGTALNRWIRSRLDGAPPTAPRAAPPPAASVLPPPAQAASGVELPATRTLVVAFASAESDGMVTVTRSERADAALRAYGGDVAYQVGDGRITVDNRRPARRYALDVPTGLGRLTVLVANRPVFDSSQRPLPAAGSLTISLSPELTQ